MKDKITNKLVKKYGELVEYPSGMTRHLKVPKLIGSSYKNPKNDNTLTEYNGSYHITFTLPYTPKIKKSDFIKMHQNFCNQLQWIEPLLLTAYFTGDEMAPGSLEKRVRGSFRVMIIGWGNLAGTDVRLLSKGIGRYAKTPTYWRKNLKFYESDKLKPCYKPSPAALQEDAITTLSSDIRTFGSTDPDRPEHRESGVGMTVPNGIEFRIFDHFQDKYIYKLVNNIRMDVGKYIMSCKGKHTDILLIADNNIIKKKLTDYFPNFKIFMKPITHFGEGVVLEEEKVKNTLLDFYLLSFANYIMSYSCYEHGSGFSYWCAKTYNIPYFCKYIT